MTLTIPDPSVATPPPDALVGTSVVALTEPLVTSLSTQLAKGLVAARIAPG